ncbi:hypothetical protein BD626DRAFT_197523 [Schizophyllum amplum]|uniref:Uncharacterized protein n=1 Tax=Schizophyllum amplum TaxID=97359 RepID=A0A550CMW4_9AGAR|nr:hypothetical protein BD626DRAFT_197523 [Auriculariopsis ampla]
MVLFVVASSARDHVPHIREDRDVCPPNTPACESDGVSSSSPDSDSSSAKEQKTDDSAGPALRPDVKGYIGIAVVCGLILIGLALWLALAKYPRRKLHHWRGRARGEPSIEEMSVTELDLKGARADTATPDDRRLSDLGTPLPSLKSPQKIQEREENMTDTKGPSQRSVELVHGIRQAYHL